jgi:hypothetical protein
VHRILAFDGSTWKVAASPHPAGAKNTNVRAVLLDSPDNGWAVGYTCTAPNSCTALMMKMTKGIWSLEAPPTQSPLYGAWRDPKSKDAWVVGYKGALLQRCL